MLSSKSIQNSVSLIDVGRANSYHSERYSIIAADMCIPPSLSHDVYGRQSQPSTLTRTQGGSCSAMDPAHHIQAWLNRENSVDRPVIQANLAGGSYDTLGYGRNMQTSASGTQDNRGGWNRVNMPMSAPDQTDCARPSMYAMTDPSRSKNIAGLSQRVYQG